MEDRKEGRRPRKKRDRPVFLPEEGDLQDDEEEVDAGCDRRDLCARPTHRLAPSLLLAQFRRRRKWCCERITERERERNNRDRKRRGGGGVGDGSSQMGLGLYWAILH